MAELMAKLQALSVMPMPLALGLDVVMKALPAYLF